MSIINGREGEGEGVICWFMSSLLSLHLLGLALPLVGGSYL
jgi:hypothetical protein